MAWTATETFESYANGNDVNTLNGGSGWSGAWSGTAGKYFIVNSPTYGGSSLAAQGANANANMVRNLTTPVSSGVVYIAMRISAMGANQDSSVIFRTTGGTVSWANLRWGTDGSSNRTMTLFDGTSFNTLISNPSLATFYLFEVTIISTNSVSVRFHDGVSWSAVFGPYTTAATGAVDNITFNQANNVTMTVDYISPTNPLATTTGAAFLLRMI